MEYLDERVSASGDVTHDIVSIKIGSTCYYMYHYSIGNPVIAFLTILMNIVLFLKKRVI